MKKYLLLLACIMFFWNLGSAQPNGTISVNVVKHLEIYQILNPDQFFTYNEFNPNGNPRTVESRENQITIRSNVNWKFRIITADGKTELVNSNRTSSTIPANQFSFYVYGDDLNGNLHQLGPTCPEPISGSKSLTFSLYWQVIPSFSAHLYAGTYTIPVVYQLSE